MSLAPRFRAAGLLFLAELESSGAEPAPRREQAACVSKSHWGVLPSIRYDGICCAWRCADANWAGFAPGLDSYPHSSAELCILVEKMHQRGAIVFEPSSR